MRFRPIQKKSLLIESIHPLYKENTEKDILREKKDESEGKDDNKRGSKKAIKCKLTQQILKCSKQEMAQTTFQLFFGPSLGIRTPEAHGQTASLN
jgi:hypothetical protein